LERKYTELYATYAERIGRGFAPALNARRRALLDDFLFGGVPDTKGEKYRYTDMRAIFGRELSLPSEDESSTAGREGVLALTNGAFADGEALSVRADGVVAGSLKAASVDYEPLVLRHLNSVATNKSDGLTALGGAMMADGLFVYVPRGVDAGRIEAEFLYDTAREDDVIFSRLLVVMEPQGRAELLVRLRGRDRNRLVVNHISEIIVGAGAKLQVSEAAHFGEGNAAFTASYGSVAGDGALDRVFVALGGATVRANYHCDLTQPGAQNSLYGLFMGADRERSDIYSEINHLAPSCSSYQMVKGVAGDEASGVFTGRIYVAPGADGTSAMQQSRNLLLTPAARIVTAPQLEIYAEDVQCSHGASVGRLDEEAVYYMRQRGLDEAQAKALQMTGFVDDIVSRCGDADFIEEIYNMSAGKISRI